MRILVSLFVLLFSFTPATAQVFDIQGVASNDTLNMREGIDEVEHFSEGAVVGAIPSNATDIIGTGRTTMLGNAEWREVNHEGIVGWVNAAYLELQTFFPEEAVFACFGTEPFWFVEFDETGGNVDDLASGIQTGLSTVGWQPALARPNIRNYRLRPQSGGDVTVIVAYEEGCSDGMSDADFSFRSFVLGISHPDELREGCCTLR